MKARVRWSSLALRRAEEIVDRIAEDRPGAAVEWVDGLFDRVSLLREAPEQGRKVREVGEEGVREVLYNGYRVMYEVKGSEIRVLTIRHQRQQPMGRDW